MSTTPFIPLTDLNFESEVVECGTPVLVVFETDWYGTSHIMAPIVERLADKYEGLLKFGKLNFEQNEEIPTRYGIQENLTFVFFRGGQVASQISGAVSESVLDDHIRRVLESPK